MGRFVRIRYLLIAALTVFAAEGTLANAEEISQESNGTEQVKENTKKKRKKKKRRKKRRKKKRKTKKDLNTAKEQTNVAPQKEEEKSPWFPNWAPNSFSFNLGPIVGFRASSTTTEGVTSNSTSAEFGLGVGLSGIPLSPGNPGLYLAPKVSYSKGYVNETVIGGVDSNTENYGYTRIYGGASIAWLYQFFKYTLGIYSGVIDWDDEERLDTKSILYSNDFGFLLLYYLSAHYTLDISRAYADQYDKPFYSAADHWIHMRLFTSVLSFFIDFGPGVTYTDIYSDGSLDQKSSLTYFKTLMGLHVFWKLGMSASAFYVFDEDTEAMSSLSGLRLPSEGINDARSSSSLPKDTMDTSLFFGLSNLFAGFGIGYRYNCRIYHAMGVDGHRKEYERDSGFGATYETAF